MNKITVIGGGIAGLIVAIRLARHNFKVQVIEKNTYPRHKVCGEYVSREVEDMLNTEGLIPTDKRLPIIDTLQISSPKGKTTHLPLKMGGIGISRFYWENYLFRKAEQENVEFIFDEVTDINISDEYEISTRKGKEINSTIIIGAHGKRSKVDKGLERDFIFRKSPYVGIKFHANEPFHPDNLIALHNFPGGYCGMSRVEDDILNFCYLCHRDIFKEAGNIDNVENFILKSNPVLAVALENAVRIFDKPLVINEISFETKSPVEEGIPMIGDAAGMITPLCGNGMAIAVHSAKMLSEIIIYNKKSQVSEINKLYKKEWEKNFKLRLAWGRFIQTTLFGKNWASSMAVDLGNIMPAVANILVSKTHGKKI